MSRRGPSTEQLRRLKALRLQAGLSLDTVAERTGLPVAHVEALEQGQIDELPAGPYVGAYYRLVRGVVGGAVVEEDDPALDPEPPPEPTLPLWVVRGIAFAAVAAAVGLFVWWASTWDLEGAVDAACEMVTGEPSVGADQVVVLTARREAYFGVLVDG